MKELKFEQVGKKYGEKEALWDFNGVLTPGIYGILGPNGAGKSTLMNLLTDSVPRTCGSITYNGTEILKMGAAFRAKIGYMPQQQGMYDQFTARRFLYYIADLKGMKKKQATQEIQHYLELTGLTAQAGKRLGGYSGGMKQRALFAAALLGNPEILILDEPTAGLDPEERIRIRNYISETARDKIVLLATHVVSDIECIAGQVLLMKRGRLVGQDSPSNLIASIEGKVAEVACTMDTAKELQETYRVGNMYQRKEGMVLRLVGDNLPEEFPRVRQGLNLEDVYLYYLEDDKER
jgi:ABC-type multidrug transport system ATPase subunit